MASWLVAKLPGGEMTGYHDGLLQDQWALYVGSHTGL